VSWDYNKDYKTSNLIELYKEEETSRNFFFKQFFGLDYPVRYYTDTAARTTNSLQRTWIDRIRPNNPELPSLQTLTLQRTSNSGIPPRVQIQF
jgi:hypothetical protein